MKICTGPKGLLEFNICGAQNTNDAVNCWLCSTPFVPSDEITPQGSLPAAGSTSPGGGSFCIERNDLHGCSHPRCVRMRRHLHSNEAWDLDIHTPDHVLSLAVQG